jgi:SAM-dependent methyltransferase
MASDLTAQDELDELDEFGVFGLADEDFVGVEEDCGEEIDSSNQLKVAARQRSRQTSSQKFAGCLQNKRVIRALRRRLEQLERRMGRGAACDECTAVQQFSAEDIYRMIEQHELVMSVPRTFGYDWAQGFVAPFVAAEATAIHSALKAIGPIGHTDYVVDLGCGDGRILIEYAATYGARALGVDLDFDLLEKGRRNAEAAGVSSLVHFEQRDLFDIDLSDFTAVLMFLLPPTLEKLTPRLREALTADPAASCTRHVVSFKWPVTGLEGLRSNNSGTRNGVRGVASADTTETDGDGQEIYCYSRSAHGAGV